MNELILFMRFGLIVLSGIFFLRSIKSIKNLDKKNLDIINIMRINKGFVVSYLLIMISEIISYIFTL